LYNDRIPFDLYAIDETQKITHPTYTIRFAPVGQAPGPGQVAWSDSYLTASKSELDALVLAVGKPEAWFIDREAKLPYSEQMSVGIRQLVGTFAVSATYAYVHGKNQMILNWANFGLNDEGRCCASFDLAPHGFSNFIYSTNDKETWYKALQLQLDRPYQRESEKSIGWGAGLAVTIASRELKGADALGDDFAFPNALGIPRHPANDEKTRIVGNWITDLPYLWGIQFSGLFTLGGKFQQDVGCPGRFCGGGSTGNAYERGGFEVPGTLPYRSVDIRFRKDLPSVGRTAARLGLFLDVFNVFNRDNLGCFNTGDRSSQDFGKATCTLNDPRRYQLGATLEY